MKQNMKYGQMFVFKDVKTGASPSDCLSFKYAIEADTPLIFIKENHDGTFMYCSKDGQHTRFIGALEHCEVIKKRV